MRRWLCWILACVPLGLKVPYLCRVWTTSPMDRRDLLLLPILLFAFFRSRRTGSEDGRVARLSPVAFVLPLLSLAGYAFGRAFSIHAVEIASAIAWISGIVCVISGFRTVLRLSPVFFASLFLIPSTTYWLCRFAGCAPLPITVAKAVVAFSGVWLLSSVSPRRALAWIACGGSAVLLAIAGVVLYEESLPVGSPFSPAFEAHPVGGWIAHEVRTTEGFRRFYGTSLARQVTFSTPDRTVNVLAVRIGDNVHEVHPASHCLRTGRWTVESEVSRVVPLASEVNLALTEIVARRKGERILTWVWYANGAYTTGRFFCYRRHAHAGAWSTYQVSTAVRGDLESARRDLHAFLGLFAGSESCGESREFDTITKMKLEESL